MNPVGALGTEKTRFSALVESPAHAPILGPRKPFLSSFSVTRRTAETLPRYEWYGNRCKARNVPFAGLLRLSDTQLSRRTLLWGAVPFSLFRWHDTIG